MKKIKFSIIEEEMKEHIIRSLIRGDWGADSLDDGTSELPLEALAQALQSKNLTYDFFSLITADDLLSESSMELFTRQINDYQGNNDIDMKYMALKNNDLIMESKETISDCFSWMYEDTYYSGEENVWKIFINNISKILENTGIDALRLLARLSSPTQIIETLLNVSDKLIILSEIHTYNPYIEGVFLLVNYIVKFSINSDDVEYYRENTWNNYDVHFEVFEVEEE
jgi:hypothetical protein